ncbi:MAG: transposase, partial [ANME-2 cluster archaeon]|nr:transposase [ANME-2 cluster archaeon]
YVVSEIKETKKLKMFMGLNNLLEIENIYKSVSKLDSKDLNTFFKSIFKIIKNSHKTGKKYVIIDTSALPIDINTWRKKNKIGKGKKYKWSYSASSGYYVGYKLILAIDAETFEILGFEIYENSPNDSKLLENFVEKLCNSRKLKQGDAVICDRGFTGKNNYHILTVTVTLHVGAFKLTADGRR